MAPSDQPRSRQPINPVSASLVRSVISRPLQELINRETTLIEHLEQRHPGLAARYKTLIFLNPEYRGGLQAAREAVVEMLAAFARDEQALAGKSPRPARLHVPKDEDLLLGSLGHAAVEHLLRGNASYSAYSGPILHIGPTRWEVIIDINLKFRSLDDYLGRPSGPAARRRPRDPLYNADPRFEAKRAVVDYINEAKRRCSVRDPLQGVDAYKTELSSQYVFARLEGRVLLELARIDKRKGEQWAGMVESELKALADALAADGAAARPAAGMALPDAQLFRAIHQIWPDFAVRNCVHRSIRTIKADAAQNSFSAFGEGITWAVIDSGIDWRHPHFAMHANIDPASPFHRDFSNVSKPSPLTDEKGHGTHVAGIIAGQQNKATALPQPLAAPYDAAWRLHSTEHERDPGSDELDEGPEVRAKCKPLAAIAGIAPKCKLVSLKVLDRFGQGKASNVIAAISHVQLINGHGRDLKIHGVNLSLGHGFDAKWFACGHSPLCVEVNRLVKSGVVVVVAAGNTGYGVLMSVEGERNSGLDLSINDPGNAELAITVGATHRDSPHKYGVSYFSSKGPTGDGRNKPDLIAPGERIISAVAHGSMMAREFHLEDAFAYCESSGTSMAAPHVSGAVAAFLSIRSEFIGEAERVKKIFTASATDLGRERYFQGAGLVDLLRAIQSV